MMDRDIALDKIGRTDQTDLEEGYREMADDPIRELHAEKWVEALIGDTLQRE